MNHKVITAIILLFTTGLITAQTDHAPVSSFQVNQHYQKLNPGLKQEQGQEVVYEFFSYMCPGCFKFEPIMKTIKSKLKPEQKIVRVPVAFYEQWKPHALTFYALQSMGKLDQVHDQFFNAIHEKRLPLRSLEDIADWLSKTFKIDSKEFLGLANSFQVDSQLRKATQMAKTAGVSGVPSIIVNGQYKPDFDQVGSVKEVIDLTTYLLNK